MISQLRQELSSAMRDGEGEDLRFEPSSVYSWDSLVSPGRILPPVSRLTWLREVVWVLVGLPVVLWAWRRFPLTRLLCWLLVLHAFVRRVAVRHGEQRLPGVERLLRTMARPQPTRSVPHCGS